MKTGILVILVIAALFFGLKVKAQNKITDSMINVVPAWTIGDTAYYRKEINYLQLINKDTIAKISNIFIIRVVFLGEADENYEMEWTYFLVKDSLRNDTLDYYYEPLYTLNYYMDSLGVLLMPI